MDVQADRAVDVDEPLGEEAVPCVERGIVVAAQQAERRHAHGRAEVFGAEPGRDMREAK